LENWLETSVALLVSINTLAAYSGMMNRHVIPAMGQLKLDKVHPSQIQSLYSDMTGRRLSPRTVRYTHMVLKSAIQQAVRFRQLPFDPADGVSLPEAAS
jgi:integrase